MRKMLAVLAIGLFTGFNAQAIDVACSCKGEVKCSDVNIKLTPATLGVFMSVEYAYGDRNLEGFATVRTDSKKDEVVYTLGNFVLLDKDGVYSLPQKPATCN